MWVLPDDGIMDALIQTDSRRRTTLTGSQPNQRYLVRELGDGRLLLEPATVVSQAQARYDDSTELQALLGDALTAKTVRRARPKRR